MEKQRCPWPNKNPIMLEYHDKEWGVPLHNDDKLFEFLVLDAFQAGLSWEIVLNKRTGFRNAFHNFNAKKIATYKEKEIQKLLNNKEIIRNKLKILATITNAQKFLDIQKEYGGFDKYIWQFTKGKTTHNKIKTLKDYQATSKESDAMFLALKQKGFKFVGSTICYAFMQAAGMVNDHTVDCFRYRELKKM